MIQLFLAAAFSSVPLTLYIPPVRNLNLFVETMEGLFGDSNWTGRFYQSLWYACLRLLEYGMLWSNQI
ncbi:Guanine nucleotide exchange factor DBS like [Actinidia chinensis var. chinensis]|uniref:Guanine nucleotide exchange factor DBS like n=1 Tax=Actinidia chinensis var. chinensis TaxID=1590841 RepID=A0A2R6QQ04_ACTCC|nr:Guanine nucleotide exchange factor DBS like [Actinidia chinensis var. chinensis]